MEHLAALLDAFSSLLWPIIIIIAFFVFRPAIQAIIESAKSRKFTIKIGGQELTMDEANAQQRSIIGNIQNEIIALKKQLAALQQGNAQTDSKFEKTPPLKAPSQILWVDDRPRNNSYYVQQLTDAGIAVDLARSTSEALKMFDRKSYDAVISDMGRNEEDGQYRKTAGLTLLKSLKTKDANVPVLFFSSQTSVKEYKAEAIRLGAETITFSGIELFQGLGVAEQLGSSSR